MDKETEIIEKLYVQATELDSDVSLYMAFETNSSEEKRFFTFISTMNLTRRYEQEFQEYISRNKNWSVMSIFQADFNGKTVADIAMEHPEGLLTKKQIYCKVIDGSMIYIVHYDRETGQISADWKTFNGVYTFMDIDDAVFEDETILPGEEYGTTWIAYSDYSVEEEYHKYLSNIKKKRHLINTEEERLKIQGEAAELYKTACSLDPGYLTQLAFKSESHEKQKFLIYIADMNLQRAQKEVIRLKLF